MIPQPPDRGQPGQRTHWQRGEAVGRSVIIRHREAARQVEDGAQRCPGARPGQRLHNINITGQHLVWNDRDNIYYTGLYSISRYSQIDIDVYLGIAPADITVLLDSDAVPAPTPDSVPCP